MEKRARLFVSLALSILLAAPVAAQENGNGGGQRQTFSRSEVAELIQAYEESLATHDAQIASLSEQLHLARQEIEQQKKYIATLEEVNQEWKKLAGLNASPQGARAKLWWALKTFTTPALAAIAAIR
ncbi:MAG TPA: hypothetical protein VNN17_06905 [Terriglobia bacterium]|nr:hypothetical protein [Terriglobia bacterium]